MQTLPYSDLKALHLYQVSIVWEAYRDVAAHSNWRIEKSLPPDDPILHCKQHRTREPLKLTEIDLRWSDSSDDTEIQARNQRDLNIVRAELWRHPAEGSRIAFPIHPGRGTPRYDRGITLKHQQDERNCWVDSQKHLPVLRSQGCFLVRENLPTCLQRALHLSWLLGEARLGDLVASMADASPLDWLPDQVWVFGRAAASQLEADIPLLLFIDSCQPRENRSSFC